MSYASTDNIDLGLLDEIDAAFSTVTTPSAFNADTEPGTVVQGVIAEVQLRQSRDYNTGEPAVWPDGKPKNEVVVTVETDEGARNVYIPTWGRSKSWLSEAVGKAGAQKVSEVLRPGSQFAARFEGRREAVTKRGEEYSYREYTYRFPAAPVPVTLPPDDPFYD
ncbi:hypothetical protein O4157_14830 [Gordonia amicalis]|uniref:hypothetical protein n=1 Tax=Gordonia amicalis TaxID=89053 RepID=UPI0022B3D2D7|nr:hypothetical protein [Gordonia amicalis]MCZ4652699.1 hypothetical protein [Gordonia amicalis]